MAERTIPFTLHPRVFEALGKDLVTNPIVAMIELAKNSYDAMATSLSIKFGNDEQGKYVLVSDDGFGMSPSEVETIYSVVATPNKLENTLAWRDGKKRRVTGERGLGRLSLARLGTSATISTRHSEGDTQIAIDWNDYSQADHLEDCVLVLSKDITLQIQGTTGTTIRIDNLVDEWTEDEFNELSDNLSRIISPFMDDDDFIVYLKTNQGGDVQAQRIEAPEFLNFPKYSVKGNFDPKDSKILFSYVFRKHTDKRVSRDTDDIYTWEQFCSDLPQAIKPKVNNTGSILGPFDFDIRAWDIGASDIEEIATTYEIKKKSSVRAGIRFHKGISLYRDGILILPKTENNRDWLGLDLRRVSRVGPRISTSQIVGYVSFSADSNSEIRDASDREKLVANSHTREFEQILIAIVRLLETQRNKDRSKEQPKRTMTELFAGLNAKKIVSDIRSIKESDGSLDDAVTLVEAFGEEVDSTREKIQHRLIHYNRMAAMGTIAQMIVHEIRNRTSTFASTIRQVSDSIQPMSDDLIELLKRSRQAVDALDSLAGTFAPLASTRFERQRKDSYLRTVINITIQHLEESIRVSKTQCLQKFDDCVVAIDPGELHIVLYNLLINSLYWINKQTGERMIHISEIERSSDYITLELSDNGPGISEEDIDLVLLPGVTNKPTGIGMGLTVVSEIIYGRGGQVAVKYPGSLGGATFVLTLPIGGGK